MTQEQDLKLIELAALTEELGLYDTPTERDRYKHTILSTCLDLHMTATGKLADMPGCTDRLAGWLQWRLETWRPCSVVSSFDEIVKSLATLALEEYRNWQASTSKRIPNR